MQTAKCTQCHMPKTAKTGAGRLGITLDGGVGPDNYWQNDISSHIFDVPGKIYSRHTLDGGTLDMPTGYTDSCSGACHAAGP
jgi:hypothetical protein